MTEYKRVYDLCIVISRNINCSGGGAYYSVEDNRVIIATLNHNALPESQAFTWFDYKDWKDLVEGGEIKDHVLARHIASYLSKRLEESGLFDLEGWIEVVERLVEV